MRTFAGLLTLTLLPALAGATPIAIKSDKNDRGIEVTVQSQKNALTIRGTAHGPLHPRDEFGVSRGYQIGQSVSFTLDIDKARTTDAFGRSDFTLKNRRIFGVDTQKGWTARQIADRLAIKVNAKPDFAAEVTHHADGSSTISFRNRPAGSPFGIFDPYGFFAAR